MPSDATELILLAKREGIDLGEQIEGDLIIEVEFGDEMEHAERKTEKRRNAERARKWTPNRRGGRRGR